MNRKRIGRKEQKDLESTTSLSSPGKKRKPRSRSSIRNTEAKLPLDSSDLTSLNTKPSTKNYGQTLKIPQGKLKKQLEQVLSLIQKTRTSLTKFETVLEAEEFEAELEKYLPKDIGVFIIRDTEVNCYQITYRNPDQKELDRVEHIRVRKYLYAKFRADPQIEKEIKRAFQRQYFARKNQGYTTKKRTKKTEDN